jgi:tRNA dimethylallyltransferase
VKLLCLVGPTAAGKTRMAVEVALALGEKVEIVSCDSMGVYVGLDIVADKPSADERRGVVHHLFDLVEPFETFTAVEYKQIARATIDDIDARGGVPMLVGGSGLYFRAVVDELEFAPTDAELRAELEALDAGVLFSRLEAADPERAAEIDPRNKRRVVRAVEVLELTGRPAKELRTSWERGRGPYDLVVAGLTWDRKELLRRAEERVRRELDAGLVDEVRRVVRFSRTSEQALGVKEMLPVIAGDETLEAAQARLVKNTKNFIRRQLSWFGADERVEWFDGSELGWDGAREAIVAKFRGARSG